jgi:hypothetical protein
MGGISDTLATVEWIWIGRRTLCCRISFLPLFQTCVY